MEISNQTKVVAAITFSKGKMYEYNIPAEYHIALPESLDLEEQFPFAIGTIGDFASELISSMLDGRDMETTTKKNEVIFAAQVLQGFDDSRLNNNLSFEVRLLSAVAFYLGESPGSTAVVLKKLDWVGKDIFIKAVHLALNFPWKYNAECIENSLINSVLEALRDYFQIGGNKDVLLWAICELRKWSYSSGSAHELLFSDILGAISLVRMKNSGRALLPQFTWLTIDEWQDYCSRDSSIREMWPAQRILGEAGIFRGESWVIQMPTSTGKTRSTELIIRSAFLSNRTKLAIVVAPFRALCHEIANDLSGYFLSDGYQVNQLSEVLQGDFYSELGAFLDISINNIPNVLVLTPEKLLYILRQEPHIVEGVGLIIYDEWHQFDTGLRWVTYELLITSIRKLLPTSAQTVLISAVIPNWAAVARWLLSDETKVISDSTLQTTRSIAFTSFSSGALWQLQFNINEKNWTSFYVPRVIIPEELHKFPWEQKKRIFPDKNDSGSIPLYLWLRLVSEGGVAIFSSSQSAADGIIKSTVDIFDRHVSLPTPASISDPDEINGFKKLFEENFGSDSYMVKGVSLGIFSHHGSTPHGIRLAIEYAMRHRKIHFIACTSTLAQGVNLPIRYLLINSAMQWGEYIKIRDFHNLIGRVWRAGMYKEGTIIFTNPDLYDKKDLDKKNRSRLISTLALLKPENAEPTSSTLLSLVDPIWNKYKNYYLDDSDPLSIIESLLIDESIYQNYDDLDENLVNKYFSKDLIYRQLNEKKAIIHTIESFLMSYRSSTGSEDFIMSSKTLAQETLAFSLARPEEKEYIEKIFEKIAQYIEKKVPNKDTQVSYGKTLLGIDTMLKIDAWINENYAVLFSCDSVENFLEKLWPLIILSSRNKYLKDPISTAAIYVLICDWISGVSFDKLLIKMEDIGTTYPYGTKRRKFKIDQIVEICEHLFSYELTLLLSAIRQVLEKIEHSREDAIRLVGYCSSLQKRLQYGLPTQKAILCFEIGFSERVISQKVAAIIPHETIGSLHDAKRLIKENASEIEAMLQLFPSYFEMVFTEVVS